jgi:hypothetical protein
MAKGKAISLMFGNGIARLRDPGAERPFDHQPSAAGRHRDVNALPRRDAVHDHDACVNRPIPFTMLKK